MTAVAASDVVFLIDVDNTLLDNDRIVADLQHYLEGNFDRASAERYWSIFEALRTELGYADYLGALQRYRIDVDAGGPEEQRLLLMSSFLVDYPFAKRLYPRALKVIEHLGQHGLTVILSDGDVVFQPCKVQRSGLWDAVGARVLIFIHKEQMLDAVQRHYPARHYVMVDDKLRILTSMKKSMQKCLTTVFVRQGHYAVGSAHTTSYPAADFAIERIGDLADVDPQRWQRAARRSECDTGEKVMNANTANCTTSARDCGSTT